MSGLSGGSGTLTQAQGTGTVIPAGGSVDTTPDPATAGALPTIYNGPGRSGNESSHIDQMDASSFISAQYTLLSSGSYSGPTAVTGMTAYSWTVSGGSSSYVVYRSILPGYRGAVGTIARFQSRLKVETAIGVLTGLIDTSSAPFTLVANGFFFLSDPASSTVRGYVATGAGSSAAYVEVGSTTLPNGAFVDFAIEVHAGPNNGQGVVTFFIDGRPIGSLVAQSMPYSVDLFNAFGLKANGTLAADWIGRIVHGQPTA